MAERNHLDRWAQKQARRAVDLLKRKSLRAGQIYRDRPIHRRPKKKKPKNPREMHRRTFKSDVGEQLDVRTDRHPKDTHDSVAALKEAQLGWAKEDIRSDKALYEFMNIAFREGLYLRDRPELFLAAVQIGPWEEGSRGRPKISDAPRAIYYTTMIVFNATTEEKRGKAGKCARAAEYLDDHGVTEENFIEELAKYGVAKLDAMAAAERREAKGSAQPASASEAETMTVSVAASPAADASDAATPEAGRKSRFKPVTVLAKRALEERLAGLTLYLLKRSKGRIAVSLNPDELVNPD